MAKKNRQVPTSSPSAHLPRPPGSSPGGHPPSSPRLPRHARPPSFLVPDLPVIAQQMTTRVISFNANEKIETSFFHIPVLSLRRSHSPPCSYRRHDRRTPTSPVRGRGERGGTRSKVSSIFEANKKITPVSPFVAAGEAARLERQSAPLRSQRRKTCRAMPRRRSGRAGRPREDPEAEKWKRKEIWLFLLL